MLARQINPGKVQEFMRSCEDATSRPHGYLIDVGNKANNRRSTTTQDKRTSRRDCKVFAQTVVSSTTTCKRHV